MNNKTAELTEFSDDFSSSYDNYYGELTEQHYLKKDLALISKYFNDNILEISAGAGKNLSAINLPTLKLKKIGMNLKQPLNDNGKIIIKESK